MTVIQVSKVREGLCVMEMAEVTYDKKSPFGYQTATACDLCKLGRDTDTEPKHSSCRKRCTALERQQNLNINDLK